VASHKSVFPYARWFPLPHFIRLVSNYHSPLPLPLPSRRSRVPASADDGSSPPCTVHYRLLRYAVQGKVWSKTAGVDRGVYGPYLVLLPPEILAVLTINEALNVTLYKVG
jgi:hypothetical protein